MVQSLVTLVLLSGLLITEANAAEAMNSSAIKTDPKVSAQLLLNTSATLMRQSANSAGEEMSYSGFYRFDLGVPLSRTLTANARMGYSQEYSYVLPNNSSGDPADIRLGLTQSWGEIRKDFTLDVGPSLFLPVSRESRNSGMQSALSLGALATQRLKGFTFMLGPQLVQFFHDVIVRWDGKPNADRSLGLLMTAGYSFTDKLSLSVTFNPTRSWTYLETTRDIYTLAYELGYTMNDNLGIALGLTNFKASALKANGLEYNYVLWDQAQFTAYFDIGLKL